MFMLYDLVLSVSFYIYPGAASNIIVPTTTITIPVTMLTITVNMFIITATSITITITIRITSTGIHTV